MAFKGACRMVMSSNLLMSFFLLLVLLFSVSMKSCSASKSCLEEGSSIRDEDTTSSNMSSTLSSPGNVFVLGFFTPDGSANKNRYLGIWYKNNRRTKIVVWVANRDKPLIDYNASLTIRGGQAILLDRNGLTHWGSDTYERFYGNTTHCVSGRNTTLERNTTRGLSEINPTFGRNTTHRRNTTVCLSDRSPTLCLSDTGNLLLSAEVSFSRDQLKPVWQSFNYPTDTFLPGMRGATESINLTSWQSPSLPATGDYTLQLQQTNLIVSKAGSTIWDNTNIPVKEIIKPIDFLEDEMKPNNLTRLVIDFTGRVQLWEYNNSRIWNLTWFEPKDRCSSYDVCGSFGSCNSYNGWLCKCLPGFKPVNPAKWTAQDFSDGCTPKSQSCGSNSGNDIMFLTLPMMNIVPPISEGQSTVPQEDCEAKCLHDCNCAAYSTNAAYLKGNNCETWKFSDITGLQEEYSEGITLHIRTTPGDIALTSRDCDPCGTYSIPYPLSTSATCGDPSYLYFHCNNATGQVVFVTSKGKFNVTSIGQDNQTFIIQVAHANTCDITTMESIILSNTQFPLFNVRNCTNFSGEPLMESNEPFVEVEIGWQSPAEPPCNISSDCQYWPHTTCKPAKDGKTRCICRHSKKWDGLDFACKKTGDWGFHYKILIACLAAVLAIVLLVGIVFIYRKGRISREKGSDKLMGDDSELIDLPFYGWESILSATNNFADENKLGTGGFGSVYKGNLSDGQEIAVKRLSTVSVQGIEEFRTEVLLIAKLQHRNLVRLLGYCVKADEKILVYEYMPNGSLDSCLFDETLSVALDWEKRFEIISGIARGILYLHQDSRLRIIHRDLKPSNILLDDDLNPKISDFGIARIVQGKHTESSTIRVVGTYGYMSPEYAHEGIFSVKSDVFSFGVIVLETISGRRNSRIFIYEYGLSLLGHAWKLWSEDRGMELADQELKESCNISQVLKCIQIALLCIQQDPGDRPTMSGIVLMLSSDDVNLPSPKQPAFSTRDPHLDNTASSSTAVDSSSNDLPPVIYL